jgi:signal transduction histidine kinase
MFTRPDSSIIYSTQAIRLAKKFEYTGYVASAMIPLARAYRTLGNDTKALQIILNALTIVEANNLPRMKATLLMQSGDIYANSRRYDKALEVLEEALHEFDSASSVDMSANTQNYIGQTYLAMGKVDSATIHFLSAYNTAVKRGIAGLTSKCLVNLGKVQAVKGNPDSARNYFKQARQVANDPASLFESWFQTASLYRDPGNRDSSAYYAQLALDIALENGLYQSVVNSSGLLSDIYEGAENEKALQYNSVASSFKDSLYAMSNNAAIEGFIDFDTREQQRELEVARTEYQNRLRMNAFLGVTFTLLMIAILLFRNNRNKQKAKRQIEKAYDQLKSTQSQLIQSEKMASLGELTAGIAHEIRNPLNFVNNFSELNVELTHDLVEAATNGDLSEVQALAKSIRENESKIALHGKRADGIVNSMMQHSRSSAGQKELTDINQLADEYLRLAYHGFRAKDVSFSANYETNFDPSLEKINVVPQDIGRVLLNLISNAFYAVRQKKQQSESDFQPTVTVTTAQNNGAIEIRVKDNGNGIPDSIKEKIFQPFFTTKPAGQGTGLGLSLSYDIVKAHGGELRVETKHIEASPADPSVRNAVKAEASAKAGSEFIIQLPTYQT